jgi:stage III sporulation protein AA
VVIVDERCEFISSDYERCEVDILRGYHRDEGVAIAIRTMSPEVLIIDELGEEDAPRLFSAVRCGIPVLASAHAASLSELMARRGLSDMIGGGVFGVFVGIARSGDGYSLTVDGI